MDTQSATMDPLGDATPLPELSFDDLLDISPTKKSPDHTDDDPLGLEEDKLLDEDDTLNTPGRKRPQLTKMQDQLTTDTNETSADISDTVMTPDVAPEPTIASLEVASPAAATVDTASPIATATETEPEIETKSVTTAESTIGLSKEITSAASTITISTHATATTTSASTNSSVNVLSCKTIKPPVVLNAKNILPKTATPAGQFIKLAKAPAAGEATSSTTASASAMVGKTPVKTAVKTANGQIIFIQKTGGIPTVRLQAKPSAATSLSTTTTASVAPATATTSTAGVGAGSVAVTGATGVSPNITTKVTTATLTTKAPVTAITTAPTTTQSTSGVTSSGTTGSKMFGIQIVRTANGSILPVKTFNSSSGAGATLSGSSLTLSPKLGAPQLAGKKIISAAGGQLVIKTPIKTVASTSSGGDAIKNVKFKIAPSSAATTTSSSTATSGTLNISSTGVSPGATTTGTIITKTTSPLATTGTTSVTPTVSSKFVMQSASGKSVVVSKQNIIKLSPGTGKTGETSATVGSTGGQLHAIQIPGKQGVQYVRVLPQSKIGALSTSGSSTSATGTAVGTTKTVSTTVSSISSTATATGTVTITGTSTSTTTGNGSGTGAGTPSVVKVNHSTIPQKFTVVRPTSTTKIMLTQSPKKDGNVTFLPVTSKVQKTLVTLPKVNMASSLSGDKRSDSPMSSPSTSSGSTPLLRGSIGPTSGSIPIIKKHKISEINKELSRVTADDDCKPPVAKKPANGSHIVLMPRSMLRNVSTISSGSSPSSFQPRPGTMQRVTVQGTPIGSSLAGVSRGSLNSLTSKKLYSVLKNNNMEHAHDKMKSLIICGQSQTRVGSVDKKTVQIKRQGPINWAEAEKKMQLIRSGNQLSSSAAPASASTSATTTTATSTATTTTAGIVNSKSTTPPTTGSITVAVQLKKDSGYKRLKPTPEPTDTGPVRRKHCNCSKSQCLKLYCDCFANGEFCQDCTCKDCFNNLQYEDERQRAIKSCLERNPSAFKPKITTARDHSDMRLHNKGCNCKRSGCLKNYCECYEAKIPCSSNCKCVGCRNVEDRPDLDFDPDDCKQNIAGAAFHKSGSKRTYERSSMRSGDHIKDEPESGDENEMNDVNNGKHQFGQNEKAQCNFITTEVIDATLQCMITQADECEKNGLIYHQTEKMVLEEFGRCLVEIIDFSIRNTDSSFTQEN